MLLTSHIPIRMHGSVIGLIVVSTGGAILLANTIMYFSSALSPNNASDLVAVILFKLIHKDVY